MSKTKELNVNNNLLKLREITANLTSWKQEEILEDCIKVKTEKGMSKAYKLLYEPEVAVAKVFMTKGCIYSLHKHDQREFVIVYSGSLRLETPSMKKTINVGDSFYLIKCEPHSVEALEDTWAIVTTVPASEVFPK